ncbi:MAG: RNase adapter RapZ [Deltaproteobacteria bacterium]|nr:RNase adapter RapZ [Deltaproteobacteria bacterium]
MQIERFIFVAGIAGAGKSTALKAMEDKGFYCLENIPIALVTSLVEGLLSQPSEQIFSSQAVSKNFAMLVDSRTEQNFEFVWSVVAKLKDVGVQVGILFLDCDDDVVIRRYSETRRPHPLLLLGAEQGRTLKDAINKERDYIASFREMATKVIDTTSYSSGQLKKVIEQYLGSKDEQLEITVMSFGFKYGIPQDADLVVDVRFLPNPFYVSELREQTGLDKPVEQFVLSAEGTQEFLTHYQNMLDYLIPRYQKEGKSYLNIAIGCTGGRHRSVALAETLARHLRHLPLPLHIRHRDIAR